jgi:hypothetical protein
MKEIAASLMTPSRPPTAVCWFYFYFTPPASLVGVSELTR